MRRMTWLGSPQRPSCISTRSSPTEKAPPAPRKTTTWMCSSAATSSTAATSWSVSPTERGFSGLGGSQTIVATRPSCVRSSESSSYSVTVVGRSAGSGWAGLSDVSVAAMHDSFLVGSPVTSPMPLVPGGSRLLPSRCFQIRPLPPHERHGQRVVERDQHRLALSRARARVGDARRGGVAPPAGVEQRVVMPRGGDLDRGDPAYPRLVAGKDDVDLVVLVLRVAVVLGRLLAPEVGEADHAHPVAGDRVVAARARQYDVAAAGAARVHPEEAPVVGREHGAHAVGGEAAGGEHAQPVLRLVPVQRHAVVAQRGAKTAAALCHRSPTSS